MTDRPPAPHAHHIRVQRTARYYTLGGRPDVAPTSLWFVLHGYGQLAGDFIRYFADLAADDTLVVAPEAMNRFYSVSADVAPSRDRPVGATWMTREDRESEVADYVEYLDGVFDAVTGGGMPPGARVNVVGFSQGAATASRWVSHGRVAGDAAHSLGRTRAAGRRSVARPALVATRTADVRARITRPLRVRRRAGRRTSRDSAAPESRRSVVRFEGGHALSRATLRQLAGA